MIRITVTGDSYQVRKQLKDNKFRWNVGVKGWQKTIGEASLNHTLEKIRPPASWSDAPSPKMTITLASVDISGKKMRDGELRLRLNPVGERAGIDVFEKFLEEVCNVHVVTYNKNTCPAKTEERNNNIKERR